MDTREIPLGAHPHDVGTDFAVFSAHASAVHLCLFDRSWETGETSRHALRPLGDGVWRITLPGVGAGQLYGYRVEGPWEPQKGHRFNPSKLLVDPYARAITGEPGLGTALFGHHGDPDLTYNSEDSADLMPRCVVVDPWFDWDGVRPPRTPWSETVIYEAHVRGLTKLHPEVAEGLRGTYLGLVAPPVLEHLRSLGVTAVELLPVHQISSEWTLRARSKSNYWGYSTLGYFAPNAGYATGVRGEQVIELKTMVRELHRAGLEVLLDVVYNHTAEGGHLGPTLAFKGLDNLTYYRLRPRQRRRYVSYTGCGNTLDIREDAVLRLVLDSLRYWVEEMHVDGFRFDLAPVLGRDGRDFDPAARFFRAVADDPALSRVKLIAEPWDLGPDGYQLGRFPDGWGEWNDRYRDAVRRFWRGDGHAVELGRRLAGSPGIFPSRPSVNYVTAHDGFTLADLVSYEEKHNHANGEDNRDGGGNNLSRNWGREGPSDDSAVRERRGRARRSLFATLALSRGVPMILAGDEIGRTQHGNNNPYCQDNELTWLDWSDPDTAFLTFVRGVLGIRRRSLDGLSEPRCLDPQGHELIDSSPPALLWSPGDEVLVLFNGTDGEVAFALPAGRWCELLDTSKASSVPAPEISGRAVVGRFSLRLLVPSARQER